MNEYKKVNGILCQNTSQSYDGGRGRGRTWWERWLIGWWGRLCWLRNCCMKIFLSLPPSLSHHHTYIVVTHRLYIGHHHILSDTSTALSRRWSVRLTDKVQYVPSLMPWDTVIWWSSQPTHLHYIIGECNSFCVIVKMFSEFQGYCMSKAS